MVAKFSVFVDEDHSKLPSLYWLPKLHKKRYKSRFIANSYSCTTTEFSLRLNATNDSLMKVESIAECSLGAFCNTFVLHYGIIDLENSILVFFLVAA